MPWSQVCSPAVSFSARPDEHRILRLSGVGLTAAPLAVMLVSFVTGAICPGSRSCL